MKKTAAQLDREIDQALRVEGHQIKDFQSLDDSNDADREAMAAFSAGKRKRDEHREEYERLQREADALRANGDLEAARRCTREAEKHLAKSTYSGIAPRRGPNAAVDQVHYIRPRRARVQKSLLALPRGGARKETGASNLPPLEEAQKESLREDLAKFGSVTCPRCGWNGLRVTKDGKIRRHGRAQTGRPGLSCRGSGLSIL